MNTLPPLTDPLLQPVRDPRARDLVRDYADMHALVAGLVLPGDASVYVMSAMETSGELIRHSYHRYEFATVAVTHSLFAPEHVRRMSGQARSSVAVVRDSTPHDHRKSCLPPRQPPATTPRSWPSS